MRWIWDVGTLVWGQNNPLMQVYSNCSYLFLMSCIPGWKHHELNAALWKCDIDCEWIEAKKKTWCPKPLSIYQTSTAVTLSCSVALLSCLLHSIESYRPRSLPQYGLADYSSQRDYFEKEKRMAGIFLLSNTGNRLVELLDRNEEIRLQSRIVAFLLPMESSTYVWNPPLPWTAFFCLTNKGNDSISTFQLTVAVKGNYFDCGF